MPAQRLLELPDRGPEDVVIGADGRLLTLWHHAGAPTTPW
ncbi:hypothetical protein [Nocardia acidivorans]